MLLGRDELTILRGSKFYGTWQWINSVTGEPEDFAGLSAIVKIKNIHEEFSGQNNTYEVGITTVEPLDVDGNAFKGRVDIELSKYDTLNFAIPQEEEDKYGESDFYAVLEILLSTGEVILQAKVRVVESLESETLNFLLDERAEAIIINGKLDNILARNDEFVATRDNLIDVVIPTAIDTYNEKLDLYNQNHVEKLDTYNLNHTDKLQILESIATIVGQDKNIVGQDKLDIETMKQNVQDNKDSVTSMKDAIEIMLDTFDDRFLGRKDSDPTTDNDGDPLSIAALYYNEIDKELKFYNGVSWDSPVAATQTYALQASQYASDALASKNAAKESEQNAQNIVNQVANSVNMMTKAQFNALAEERKANRAGSGFDEWGKHTGTTGIINEGMAALNNTPNTFAITDWNSTTGVSKSLNPIANINGIKSIIKSINNNANGNYILLPTSPNIYPHDTVLTPEQIASGVLKHTDASNSGLIVNGKFDTDTRGWASSQNGTIIFNSGKAIITANGLADGGAIQAITTIIGKKYIVECDMSLQSGASMYVLTRDVSLVNTLGSAFTVSSTTNRFSFEFTAISSVSYIYLRATTSSSGTVDNIAVYPADAISRSDLVFLESFHEDISEKNFVYPLGSVQYLGGNADGLTGIANGAFTGFETYSLFGNWQAPSALIGKGYVWSSLTEAQKRAFVANPENNCYLDGDKVIQVRHRVRVVQGLGDSWKGIEPQLPIYMCYAEVSSNYVAAKGKSVSLPSEFRVSNTNVYIPSSTYSNSLIKENGIYEMRRLENVSSFAYEGKCYALPIALVHRKNSGLYHNTYNPNGSKKASDDNFWYNTAVSFTSISDCFDQAKLQTASGYIGTVSGRPDGLFYDQVHEGDILDLRKSSKKVEDYNRLISREFNKLVSGSMRGKEGEWEVLTKTGITLTYGNYFGGVNTNNYLLQPNSILPLNQGTYIGIVTVIVKSGESAGKIIRSEYITIDANYFQIKTNLGPVRFTDGTIVPILTGATVDIIFARQTARTKSNTLLHCDIIGNPANYPTSWKESEVFGTPLIVAEDGTSLLPDGVLDNFKLSRKANATPLLCLRSTDNGATWASFTPTFNTTTNAITLTDEPATNLVMVYYQTHTSMAVPVVNSEVVEMGDVYATSSYPMSYLANTLINKTLEVSATQYKDAYVKLDSYYIDRTTKKMYSGAEVSPLQHIGLSFSGTTLPTFKVFPYLTRLNGKAYLNLVFKEMKYGSYLAPTVVTEASATYTQNLTYKINVADCALDGKVIKWTGTTATSAIDWSLYDVSPAGVIYLLSTGVVNTNAKLYDGDSWGDDSKFNIVDNVSRTLDDNGQTVIIGQKTVELPYFIGADE